MKVALCLHGISSGKNFKLGGLDVGFEDEFEHYKDNFILPNDADVFIHTWESDRSSDVVELYEPKSQLIEKQKTLKKNPVKRKVSNLFRRLKGEEVEEKRLNNIFSRWYSYHKVLELLSDYEHQSGIKYDYVMVARFDMTLLRPIYCNQLEPNGFYAANWIGYRNSEGIRIPEDQAYNHKDKAFKYYRGFPTNDEGLLDFWFISSSSIMKEFSNLYNNLDALLRTAGFSNHKIALEQLRIIDRFDKIRFAYNSYEDFCLTRWMSDES